MSLGKIVASIEIIVTVWGSLKLAESLGQFRWENRIAKVIFYLAVIFRIGLGIINLQWSKFSDIGVVVFSSYMLLVVLIFYRTDVLKTVIVHSLYYYTLMMYQIAYLFVVCYIDSVVLNEYINEKIGNFYPYYHVHIMGMCTGIIGVYLFTRLIRNKKILSNYGMWFYAGCIIIIFCELLIDTFLLSRNMMLIRIDRYILCLALLLIWVLASIGCILISIFKCIRVKHQQNQADINMKLLSEQYVFMQQSYEDKRCQIHDILQRDIMVLGMLENRQYEKAITHLKGRIHNAERGENKYTGLTIIDVMLNHKISAAEHDHIRFNIVADIYTYPLNDNDLCVLMGNLLDNAIEAVKNLPKEQREIEIIMKPELFTAV